MARALARKYKILRVAVPSGDLSNGRSDQFFHDPWAR